MKVKPYGGMVLVRIEAAPKTTATGLHIPEDAQKRPCRGEVLAVGHGRVEEDKRFRRPQVEVGDRVLFTHWGSHEVPFSEDQDLRLVSAEYILGVYD